jgi:hypothetical protein
MKPSAERILLYLRRNRDRAVPSVELMNNYYCIDFRKRISELRRDGYLITSSRVDGKPYSAYRLILEVQDAR